MAATTTTEPTPSSSGEGISEQTGKHLEDSLTHLVEHSTALEGGRQDELAGEFRDFC
jgi:hypothetical protein